MKQFSVGGEVVVPGHEKTLAPLQKIAAAYREASFDSSGKYSFSQQRQDAAVVEIRALSQFYTHSDAVQMLGRAVSSLPRSASGSKLCAANRNLPSVLNQKFLA